MVAFLSRHSQYSGHPDNLTSTQLGDGTGMVRLARKGTANFRRARPRRVMILTDKKNKVA